MLYKQLLHKTGITTLAVVCALSACKKGFLDQVPDDRLTTDKIFKTRENTLNYLSGVYSRVPDESYDRFVGDRNCGPWTAASDEAKYTWSFVGSNFFNLGTTVPTQGYFSGPWSRFYQGIRDASYFMKNVDMCPELTADQITQYKAEARAIRAMYYYYLVRMFGPVVLAGDEPIAPDASFESIQLPRNTMDECVEYIVNELDKAAGDLKFITRSVYNNANPHEYGRVTKGIAIAFKAQTLLLAASPLFNGNTDYAELKNPNGTQLISQNVDAGKWKRAADAYKAFLTQFVPGVYDLYKENDAQGSFSPYLSCRNVMLTNWNSEWIWGRPSAGISVMQYARTPYHSGSANEIKGGGGLGVTQTMVDAYFMANGLPITHAASGYVNAGFSQFKAPGDIADRSTFNQWVNREPRFYVGVTYDGSHWLNNSFSGDVVTSTQFSGNSGKKSAGSDFSPTGYIVRKNMSTGRWSDDTRHMVLMRLSQVYLDYAEALNESEPGNPDILKYLNLIRERAGIPQYGTSTDLAVPATQDAMRQAIRTERRVELAFECVRYFDTRRWKIAEQTDAGAFYGLNIDLDGAGFYTQKMFETRVFNKKHYLFPIPQGELDKDKQLVQNTGW
jgi:starch-binding outer membrane protein, SusD/RagB family